MPAKEIKALIEVGTSLGYSGEELKQLLRCAIHSWLIWCKNYRNWSIFAKKLRPRFLYPTVYL